MKTLAKKEAMLTKQVGKRLTKYTAVDVECAERMYQRITMVVPYLKAPKDFALWADTLRKMQTIDGIPLQTIGEVFRWANQHEFWGTNILSPDKLRKQFARLHAQMLQELSTQKADKSLTKNRTVEEQLSDKSWAARPTRDRSLQEDLTDTSWADHLKGEVL